MKKISVFIWGVINSGLCGGVSIFLGIPEKVVAMLNIAISSHQSIGLSLIFGSIIGFGIAYYFADPQKFKDNALSFWTARNKKIEISLKYIIAVLVVFVLLTGYGVYKITADAKQHEQYIEQARTNTEDIITGEFQSKMRRLADQIADLQNDNRDFAEKIEKLISASPENRKLWESLNRPTMVNLGSGNIELNLKRATMNGCGKIVDKDEGDAIINGEDWKMNCPTEKEDEGPKGIQ